MALLAAAPSRAADVPTSLDIEPLRAIPVQHDGRWPPLDTVARDYVEEVTGHLFHNGHDPVSLLLAWTFDPETWRYEPLIAIKNAELRAELRLPASKTVFSYEELINHEHLRMLMETVGGDRKSDPLESKVNDISKKLMSLQTVFLGEAIKAIPDPKDVLGAWSPIELPLDGQPAEIDAVTAAWIDLGKAFIDHDAEAFSGATTRLAKALQHLPSAHQPDSSLIATELRYNKLRPFRTAWKIMVAGSALAAVAMIVRRRWADLLAVLAILAGFGVLTYGLSMRWQIAGRIPAANMFESLLFLSWGMGAFAIVSVFVLRHRLVPLTASMMGAGTLVLADCLPTLDSYIRPIVPVLLDTIWMSIHVPIIMVSYSVLALAVLIAHVQLVAMAAAPQRSQVARTLDTLHYWYVYVGSILLFVGIVTGSMWAASSWGRYWGWDPKEVWSLIAFVGYMAILHVRLDHRRVPEWAYLLGGLMVCAVFALVFSMLAPLTAAKLLGVIGATLGTIIFLLARGRFATAVKSIVAFWLIIMTYLGVNYVLGTGLHTYGFGTGAVVRYMFLVGGIDLGFIALCSLVYLLRQRPHAAAGGVQMQNAECGMQK